MKDTHLYIRLNDYNAFRSIASMLRTYDLDTVKEIYNNLLNDAHDHPKFNTLKLIYEDRVNEKG